MYLFYMHLTLKMESFLQGRRVREQEEIVETYHLESHESRLLNSIVVEILCYRGPDKNPQWTDVRPGKRRVFLGSSTSPDVVCLRRVLYRSMHYLCRHF